MSKQRSRAVLLTWKPRERRTPPNRHLRRRRPVPGGGPLGAGEPLQAGNEESEDLSVSGKKVACFYYNGNFKKSEVTYSVNL